MYLHSSSGKNSAAFLRRSRSWRCQRNQQRRSCRKRYSSRRRRSRFRNRQANAMVAKSSHLIHHQLLSKHHPQMSHLIRNQTRKTRRSQTFKSLGKTLPACSRHSEPIQKPKSPLLNQFTKKMTMASS